jgi:uncharacterized membrane protein YbhN (UPF0104 family)
MSRKLLSQLGSFLLSFILFALSVWAISHELHDIRKVWESFANIPKFKLWIAGFLTIINYIMLTGYDTLAMLYIRHPLPYRKTALAAVISYAISNSVGFALLSGSAIRYRLYTAWGFSVGEIAQIIAFCNFSFWLGLFAVGGVLFLIQPLEIPSFLGLPFESVHPLGLIFLGIVLLYLLTTILSKKSIKIGQWTIPHLSLNLSVAQIIVTSIDWALAAAVLYSVLPPLDVPLSYSGFFGIYLLGQIAGIVSNIPGGLGVFEGIILFLLAGHVAESDTLLGSLFAYRGIYYFLPLIVSVFLLLLYEIKHRLNH